MANPFSNKKKIRGWKRRIKQIEQWKLRSIELDVEQLLQNQREYVKLWIDPWYRLVKRNPPLWYSRLLLAAMIEVYHSWHEKLSQFDESFYLKMWLYYPNFINSQIVVAFRDCLHFYDDVFDKSDEKKAFPYEAFGNRELVERFAWQLHIDSHSYWLSEIQEDIQLGFHTEKQVAAIMRKAYKSESVKLSYGIDTVFKIKAGDVWVGELYTKAI
ncbi:hypothetical protein [Aneurinibacillus migulanus]|uniref:hypothetical protein n=1 Tax=Aneurinibacillus migulanus TaxID=47500 RepID=UPI00209E7F21|nr:hypothetical protein [Aneurinibacillus migulanus]MCP1357227.1 hypothetical protein [Aneurinibacillus migulanus]